MSVMYTRGLNCDVMYPVQRVSTPQIYLKAKSLEQLPGGRERQESTHSKNGAGGWGGRGGGRGMTTAPSSSVPADDQVVLKISSIVV